MAEEMTGEVAVVESTAPTSIVNQFDIVDVDAAEAFMENYQELVERLLDESDYQQIGDKKAKKKSAWRKLATAFNISDEVVNEEITRDETNQIVSAKYYVRAVLPNGRSATAVGSCSIYDKIRYKRTGKYPADKETPSNFILRGRFSNAEHDVPSTAHTRAKSRAISDLIGAGEVSAEEMGAEKKSVKKSKKTVKKTVTDRPNKPKTAPIETKAEVVKEEPAEVVEAELVTDEPKSEPKSEPKKKTIKVLKEEYPQVGLAITNLQSNKTKVTRENIVAELLRLYEENEVTLDEYRTVKKELVE